MCERCEKVREDCWAEIRDILNFNRKVNGPVSEAIKARLEEAKNDPNVEFPDDPLELSATVDAVRVALIAQRCAFVARACPETRFHGAPPSYIMGEWAREMMHEEISIMLDNSGGILGIFLSNIFGPQGDDNDD